MSRTRLALAPLFLALACGSSAAPGVATPKAPAKRHVAKQAPEPEVVEWPVETRSVGDFFVYRYSGSFTREPLVMTEQVVAEEFGLLVVDLVLEQGDQMSALRVRMHPGGKVVSVGTLGADGEAPATLADYEAFVARTQFVPDSNDEQVDAEDATCLIGNEEADCRTTRYRIRIGEKQGILSVTKSASVPGRDVAGEVLGADGALLYRAELLETGHEEPGANALAWAGRSLRHEPVKSTP
jgi:hypothetical protein